MSDNELIAFSDAAYPDSLDELFGSIEEKFEIQMDKHVHSVPGGPISAEQAGIKDAMKTPPVPGADSTKPPEGSYISDLYHQAGKFFDEYITKCEDLFFSAAPKKIDELMSAETWSKEKFDPGALRDAVSKHEQSKQDFEEYKEEYRGKIGSGVLEASRPSPLIFVAFVFFVVVFEFVWVWYFLSEQLGLSAAIYVSMVATTLVTVIAALCAFSYANTAKDLEEMRRRTGYGGIIFCIMLFLFGIGLLSGWRADATKEGIALVVEGYRSLTKIDVFVTAVINFAGFIFLTHEFKRFFWPHPLFHYAQRIKLLGDKQAEIEREKNALTDGLEQAKREISHNKSEIEKHLGVMDDFQTGIINKMQRAAKNFESLVANYQGKYAIKNLEYRTVGAYEAPAWLDECTFTVSNKKILEMQFQEKYEEYQEKSNAHFKKLEEAKKGIEDAHATIEDIAKVTL